jgi:hypothetical protein
VGAVELEAILLFSTNVATFALPATFLLLLKTNQIKTLKDALQIPFNPTTKEGIQRDGLVT